MRLIAVILLSLMTAYWAIYALYLLFLPDGAPGATVGVLWGAICLAVAALTALVTWGTATRKWGLHILAIVVSALGMLPGVLALLSKGTWDVYAFSAVSLAALVLLIGTVPRPVKK